MQPIHLPPHTIHATFAGSGTPVVLVHGLSGSSRWWERNIDALAARHRVAAADLRHLPFEEASALLGRWLETFGEPVHLVGHSMGGQLAIHLAAERPELVRSLLLVSAAGMPFAFDPLAHVRPLPKPPYGGWRIARVLVPDFVRVGPTSVARATARILRDDARAWMHNIDAPTLLVWGAGDPFVPVRYAEAMLQEIPNARLVVLPHAAHVAMWDEPEEFNRIALAFFEDAERMPPRPHRDGIFNWGIRGWTDGIAHREAGHRRDIVLVHGLGMSSAYFDRFAKALYARGLHPIALDLPGFGESANGLARNAEEHARVLSVWADRLSIRNAIWIGHSIGCNAVALLATLRPDLLRASVPIGPLWTRSAHPALRVFPMLALDAFREPLALFPYVLRAYWRAGVARWYWTWHRYAREMRKAPPSGTALAGERDPLPDRAAMRLREVPGAHACHFSHPEEVADAVTSFFATTPAASLPSRESANAAAPRRDTSRSAP